VIYIVLGLAYEQFSLKQVVQNFYKSSLYLVNHELQINAFFSKFLSTFNFGFELLDLLPTIQYVSTYFILPKSYDIPEPIKARMDQIQEVCLFVF